MSDRRPHWDDALVTAVIHEIGVLRPSPPPLANTAYAVIAAVEDWQVQHAREKVVMVAGNPGTYVGVLEAAIQRVRELHHFVVDEIETREGPEDVQHCSECGYIPTDEEPCPTLVALNTATWLRSLTDGGAE